MSNLKTIYLPYDVCKVPSGVLVGAVDEEENSVYVVAVVHFPINPENFWTYIKKHHRHRIKDGDVVPLRPLGVWCPINSWQSMDKDFCILVPNLFRQEEWISIIECKTSDNNVAFKVEHRQKSKLMSQCLFSETNFEKSSTDTVLVLYQQRELWDGEIAQDSFLKVGKGGGSLEKLFQITQNCKDGILSYESGLNPIDDVIVTHCCVKRELSIAYFLCEIFVQFFLLGLHFLVNIGYKAANVLPSWILMLMKICKKCISYSSFLSHITRRVSDFSESLMRIFSSDLNGRRSIENSDVITAMFVDALLGILLLCVLGRYDLLWSQKTTKDVFLPYVEAIASQVEELIKWLMGIPAGLKLNHSLNQFLGHFFLYHVRLWLEYAKMMMELLPNMITWCLMCSCLGFSFFLNIVADAVSTLSFHVYCFYVYAGRLYGLQVSALMSMWRLFRGKKWNPLRKRVDSLEESGQRADQLFAGTLLFTVLLFLLPTTALYYGIFVLLRIGILAVQALLSWMIFITSEFPYYSVLLRISKPHKFIKSMRISWISPNLQSPSLDTGNQVICHDVDQAIAVHMQIDPVSLTKVVGEGFARRTVSTAEKLGLKLFLTKLITGDLIRWS